MKVTINNIDWEIKFSKWSSGDLKRYNGSYTIGMTDNITKTIYLYEGLKDHLLYKVICHELVHAYCFSYNIYMDEEDEERMADFIATYGSDIFTQTDQIFGNLYLNVSGYVF